MTPIWLLALRLAAESLPPDDRTWATVYDLDADGTAKPRPLYISDLPAFADRVWAWRNLVRGD
jgi:hypothetical protein